MVQSNVDDVAHAIARKDRCVLLVSPAAAANQFGLSTQVPSKHVYMTDGPTRTRTIGRQVIQFRNASRAEAFQEAAARLGFSQTIPTCAKRYW
jgi:hypothetical protein